MNSKIQISFIVSFFAICVSLYAQRPNLYGVDKLTDLMSLPVLDTKTVCKYEGSIDKKGGNADWDWYLYEDENHEWVIFDVPGAGCIYNFVQHRYLASQEAIFKFYFDGEKNPRFEIKSSEFGVKYPFVEPLASKYIGPEDNGRGPIRVIRSFVPMPFKKSCKITSNVKLEGCEKSKGAGGWGHVVYQQFSDSNNIVTYNGNENYAPLINMWKRKGSDPKPTIGNKLKIQTTMKLDPDQQITLFDEKGVGIIKSVKLQIQDFQPENLEKVWIKICWDNHSQPDVYCPIGSFFGNSIGLHDTGTLLMGVNVDGSFYNYFPMPYWENATIVIENRGTKNIQIAQSSIAYADHNDYNREKTGYFRSSKYYDPKYTPGADSKIAFLSGYGKMVAAHVTCYAAQANVISCEGDVRISIDDRKTPQIESDGSESYICYGWGFPTPSESHPSGSYDGLPDNPWSMTKLCIGDSYPFYKKLQFTIESGEHNNQYLIHSGCIFYYGNNVDRLILTDSIYLSSKKSVKTHNYKINGLINSEVVTSSFEGEDESQITGEVKYFTGQSSFYINIEKQNKGIKLRRVFDQNTAGQAAQILVDDCEIDNGIWYFADSNENKRWIEDDFEIPEKYTTGKSRVKITIKTVSNNSRNTIWSESAYKIYCYL